MSQLSTRYIVCLAEHPVQFMACLPPGHIAYRIVHPDEATRFDAMSTAWIAVIEYNLPLAQASVQPVLG